MVHGAAGSSAIGSKKNLWAPAAVGRDFDLNPTSLRSLRPFRDQLTIVSNTDCSSAEPFTASEIGGDHFRSSAVFLTQAHPRQTQGADVQAGVSLDQLYAQRFGQSTPIPSLQLCIEQGDQGGGCGYGYSCAYTDTISWASPTRPLPMVRDPRVVFDTLFGVLRLDETPEALYGSAMGDSNLHNHKRVPFFMAGRAGGALNGGEHLKAPNGTPLADVMLSVLHKLGLNDVPSFGDSEGVFEL